MRWFLVAAAIALSPTAYASPRSLHDIPWYLAHDAARTATLKLCHSDEAYGRLPDCANAERAEDKKLYSGTHDFLDDPDYWTRNRLARANALAQCAAGRGLLLRYCAAARKSKAEHP